MGIHCCEFSVACRTVDCYWNHYLWRRRARWKNDRTCRL